MQGMRIPDVSHLEYQAGDFTFHCSKRSVITKSTLLDTWSHEWKMKLPEMVYGDNSLTVTLDGCGDKMIITPQHILQNRCRETEFEPLKVASATSDDHPEIAVHSDGYHWTFPSFAGAFGYDRAHEQPVNGTLPYEILSRRDPICWYQTFLLYEDDLHDFGYVVEECRIRVMPSYFYILLQCYLRVDRKCVYVMSHRYFGTIGNRTILHDFSVQKLDWARLADSKQEKQLFDDVRNVNQLLDQSEMVNHAFSEIRLS